MYSASAGRLDMVKILVSNGADQNIVNLDGFKAIDLACSRQIYKVLKENM
jgi:ankyrin repeat protein